MTLDWQFRLAREVTEHINWADVDPVPHYKVKITMTKLDDFRYEATCRNAPTFRTIQLLPLSV